MGKTPLMLAAVFVAVGLLGRAAAADSPQQLEKKFETTVPVELDYLLYLPKDYEQQEKWPLVIFLHGAGERGDDLELVKKHGPPKLIEAGQDFPAIVVSPQCPSGRWWPNQLLELGALVEDLVKSYKVDEDRVYLTGLSMGGFGSWALAAHMPERFAALVPICGGGEALTTRALTKTPIWVFHGAKDPIVPLKRSEDMVAALERQKGNVKFTVYPEASHDSWTATYDDPKVWEWLFEQQRPPKETP